MSTISNPLDPYLGGSQAPAPSKTSVQDRGVSKRILALELFKGAARSKVLMPPIVATIGGGLAILVLVIAMSSRPIPRWMYVAAGSAGFAATLFVDLFCFSNGSRKKIEFELGMAKRLLKGKNYDVILNKTKSGGGKLILGAMPNSLKAEGKKLQEKEKVGAVLAIVEEWEQKPRGLSVPHTQEEWKQMGVAFKNIQAADHTILSNKQLKAAAAFIIEEMKQGKTVYVHCKAGNGRSAQAVLMALIHEGMTKKQAAEAIKKQRKSSTIGHKLTRLPTTKNLKKLLP